MKVKKQELYDLYWTEKLSQKQIGEEFGLSDVAIHKWMKKYGIPTRKGKALYENAMKKRPEPQTITKIYDDFELGYISATVDADGAIGIIENRKKGKWCTVNYCPYILITNTNLEFVRKNRNMIDAFDNEIQKGSKTEAGKPVYRLWIKKIADVLHVLRQIHPYLSVKQDQAKLVMEFCELRLKRIRGFGYSEREIKIVNEVRKLNGS